MMRNRIVTMSYCLAFLAFFLFLSCASKKDDCSSEVSGQALVESVVAPVRCGTDAMNANMGMIKFVGITPMQAMQNALEKKDAEGIMTVLFNALSLDSIMPDGRTVRQAILETGDEACISVISRAESFVIENDNVLR